MFTVSKDTPLDSDLIIQAIEHNDEDKVDFDTLEDYYIGKHQIFSRTKAETRANNKVMVNHAKYITDINTSYLIGQPVDYQAKKEADLEPIIDMYNQQSIPEMDYEISKTMSVFGRAYEYIFADEDKNVISKKIDPRNCIIIYDDTFKHEKMYAVIYERDEKDGFNYLMTLDKDEMITWTAEKEDGDIVLEELASRYHRFKDVPVIQYNNNSDEMGDFEQVVSLIDAYNVLASDRVNDKEDLVNAILMIKGMELPKQFAGTLRANRILSNIPADGDAKYITKQLNESELTILRTDLLEDIHKISMTPNLSDENFVGNASGVAIKYKLIAFENNVKTKERFFEKGLIERMILYSQYLTLTKDMKDQIVQGDVDVVFKRNLPQNDLESSQMVNNLTGLVDSETLLGQLSFIKDAEEVLQRVADEKKNMFPTGEYGTIDETLTKIDAEAEAEVSGNKQTILERLGQLVK